MPLSNLKILISEKSDFLKISKPFFKASLYRTPKKKGVHIFEIYIFFLNQNFEIT